MPASQPSPGTASGRAGAASHKDMANAIRALAMDAVQKAKSGHPGMPMGMADVATVLFTRFLKYDPADPDWPDRDRFVLSAGHGSMLLYALLYLTGYPEMTMEEIEHFRQFGSKTAGHPEHGHAPGIETTTGPLGQGIATAVGMALAERMMAARYGEDVVDHRTWVIAGDGDMMEGLSHEAASFAGNLGLSKLTVLYDDNHISIDGDTTLSFHDDVPARFAAYGWHSDAVDGQDPESVARAIEKALAADRPSLIACRTTIAYGAPTKAGTAGAHGSPLGEDEIKGARKALGWPYEPFVIPDEILGAWREAGGRGAPARAAWRDRLDGLFPEKRAEFDRVISGQLPADWEQAIDAVRTAAFAAQKEPATRQASGNALAALVPAIPELTGGSADLTPSNNTRVKDTAEVAPGDFSGRYIHYGVREHAMAAAMNGLALHGGIIPYGGTFLVFVDYLRPALRLAALMRQRVIFVLTHDSIGLGEDGPTHQPVEQIASVRAMPNVRVFRPADAVETAECWALALENATGPSVLALTRQAVAKVRTEDTGENLSARGGYIAAPAKGGTPEVTLLATGSEVGLALEARDRLEEAGIPTQVSSLPCWEIFNDQPVEYRDAVLGGDCVRIGVEAAVEFGWERYLGPRGAFVGMHGFGASAPYEQLYAHFGLTSAAIVETARARLRK